MRQIFSIRFFAAIAAVVGLALLVTAVFGDAGDSVAELAEPEPIERRIELVEVVFSVAPDDGAVAREPADLIDADGIVTRGFELVIDLERRARIAPGTHGEITCERLDEVGRCAVLADLLGDGVVWFSLVPVAPNREVELPAIVALDGGLAQLENGVRLPYAPILTRTCDTDYPSFRAFQADLGTAFTSVYDLDAGELTEVRCTPTDGN